MIRDLSAAGSFGVLLDDPLTGRLLLDCGVGVAAAAALDGVSLAGLSGALFTGDDPHYRDPAVVGHLSAGPLAEWTGVGSGVRLAVELEVENAPDETAWLLRTSRGSLLHYPGRGRLSAQALAQLPAQLILSREVNAEVRAQLAPLCTLVAPGRRILVTGGARSGKSGWAERRLAAEPNVIYLAPGPAPTPEDVEWSARVARHRERRPAHWITIEGTDVRHALAGDTPVLVDCLGTWLTATMDATKLWEPTPVGSTAGEPSGEEEFRERLVQFVQVWAQCPGLAIAVTNEVGSGVVPATSSGRRFRDELGRLNQVIAEHCDEVWLCTAGIGQRLK